MSRQNNAASQDVPLPDVLLNRARVRRILIMPLYHSSDVLLTTPVLSTLCANYPNALIDVLVYSDAQEVLVGNDDIYLTHVVRDGFSFKGRVIKAQCQEEYALWRRLRAEHYDLVVNLSNKWRAALYCRLLKSTYRLGFHYPERNNRLWRACHSKLVSVNAHWRQHAVINNLGILAPLLLPTVIALVKQTYRQRDIDAVDWLCRQYHLGHFVVLHPDANWPVEGFRQVIDHLVTQGESVVVTGGKSAADTLMVNAILAKSAFSQRVINLTGKLVLPELAVLIERAKLFIGVDSLPMHMAAALKTPSVILFGSDNLTQWSPWLAPHSLLWREDYRISPSSENQSRDEADEQANVIPVVDVIRAVEHRLALLTSAG
ncbi:TPA: putative lipopolysaccharide heptosyltransferase III [Serratia marcescens]